MLIIAKKYITTPGAKLTCDLVVEELVMSTPEGERPLTLDEVAAFGNGYKITILNGTIRSNHRI